MRVEKALLYLFLSVDISFSTICYKVCLMCPIQCEGLASSIQKSNDIDKLYTPHLKCKGRGPVCSTWTSSHVLSNLEHTFRPSFLKGNQLFQTEFEKEDQNLLSIISSHLANHYVTSAVELRILYSWGDSRMQSSQSRCWRDVWGGGFRRWSIPIP